MAWSAPLNRRQLKILHLYRRIARPSYDHDYSRSDYRWRMLIDEAVAEISRMASPSEEDFRTATHWFFSDLHVCLDTGHLDARGLVGFSEYRLTEKGNALLDRWKKAGYPA